MWWFFLQALILIALTGQVLPVAAQVIPSTPSQFGKRSTGLLSESGGSSSVGLRPGKAQSQTIVRQINYIALSESRQFTSNDGRTLIGKVIAWEQTEQQLTPGQDPALQPAPALPAQPTVLREGKVRLLVRQQPFEVAVERLAPADQKFIHQIQAAIQRASSPKTAPSKPAP